MDSGWGGRLSLSSICSPLNSCQVYQEPRKAVVNKPMGSQPVTGSHDLTPVEECTVDKGARLKEVEAILKARLHHCGSHVLLLTFTWQTLYKDALKKWSADHEIDLGTSKKNPGKKGTRIVFSKSRHCPYYLYPIQTSLTQSSTIHSAWLIPPSSHWTPLSRCMLQSFPFLV